MRSKAFLAALSLALLASGFGQTAAKKGNTTPKSPRIVAQVALTNQTQPIPLTTIFTPKSDGLFRISAYMNSPTSCSCLWVLVFYWTDDAQRQVSASFGESGGSGFANPNFVVRGLAGQPLSALVNDDEGGSSYDLNITVERLQ